MKANHLDISHDAYKLRYCRMLNNPMQLSLDWQNLVFSAHSICDTFYVLPWYKHSLPSWHVAIRTLSTWNHQCTFSQAFWVLRNLEMVFQTYLCAVCLNLWAAHTVLCSSLSTERVLTLNPVARCWKNIPTITKLR